MKSFFLPFKIIYESKSEFTIWFLFTIVTGQIGIIANVVVRYYTSSTPLTTSIYTEAVNGSFFTFSIALVASILGPLFINFINSKKLSFKILKTFTIIVSIFFLLLTGIIYAAIQSTVEIKAATDMEIDKTQLFFYIFSLILVSYGYCVLRLETSNLNFSDIDDPSFAQEDNKKRDSMIDSSENITADKSGVKL